MSDAPTVLRFPKGDVADPVAAVRSVDGIDILHETGGQKVEVLVVGVGAFAGMSVEVGEARGSGPHRACRRPALGAPVSPALVELARSAGAVAVVEDNLVNGGIGSAVTFALREAGSVPVHTFGIPKRFLAHASRPQLLEELGLTADTVVPASRPSSPRADTRVIPAYAAGLASRVCTHRRGWLPCRLHTWHLDLCSG